MTHPSSLPLMSATQRKLSWRNLFWKSNRNWEHWLFLVLIFIAMLLPLMVNCRWKQECRGKKGIKTNISGYSLTKCIGSCNLHNHTTGVGYYLVLSTFQTWGCWDSEKLDVLPDLRVPNIICTLISSSTNYIWATQLTRNLEQSMDLHLLSWNPILLHSTPPKEWNRDGHTTEWKFSPGARIYLYSMLGERYKCHKI